MFTLQIEKVRFSLNDLLETTLQQGRWSRNISFHQETRDVIVVDRSRGDFCRWLSISSVLNAIALDDLDHDDLLGDVYNWVTNRQLFSRDLFSSRLARQSHTPSEEQ